MFSLKRRIHGIFTLLLILFCFIPVAGCGLFPEEEEALAPPLITAPEVTYKTEEATIGFMENSITCTGYLVPVTMENHYFRYLSGRLKEIYINMGDDVKKGDLVAELLTDNVENDIKIQEKTVALKNKIYLNSKKLADLETQSTSNKLHALEVLYAEMSSNPVAYDAKEIDKALQDLTNEKTAMQELSINNEIQLETKLSELEIAKMKLDALQNQLYKSRLYAVKDGVVTYVASALEGDSVDAYSTIATIADITQMQLEYRGDKAGSFKLGMTLDMEMNQKIVSGVVVQTPSSVPYEEMEKYKDTVRIKIDQIPNGMQRGDAVTFKLVLEHKENVVQIPKNALHLYNGSYIAYILEDGLRVEIYVKKGIESVNKVEIIEGITPGEKVILE